MPALETTIQTLAARVREYSDTIGTEEAAKTSVVLPFLQGLGYDVFNPSEVIPEFTADTPGRKGEKVDYAIQLDGEVRVLIECKGLNTSLDIKHFSQIYRYFTVTNARFAILTNGQIFDFYTDLEEPNKLDKRPFFSFDLLDASNAAIGELKKFERSAFDVNNILATAETLKYVSQVKKYLSNQMESPNTEFIRLVTSEVHDGRNTAQIRELVENATKMAFREIIRDAVQARLSTALEDSSENEIGAEPDPKKEIETTREEIEGMLTIRAIVRDVIDGDRVDLRDAKSYCAVLVDDNNRKPLARMHFNTKNWQISLFDGSKEERVKINSLNEIYDYSDRLRATAKEYA
ncbi:restriction endonuclease [Rhodobacteraceae bacterium WD3A24]|nr:restriction endonuclease [Rhodobacteraceae bacterium WD3A24]